MPRLETAARLAALALVVVATESCSKDATRPTMLPDGQRMSAAAVSVDLDQCANDPRTIACSWQNGDLNGNNSTYAEGLVVPFRLAIEGLSPGTHTIHINYDFAAGGEEGYDFLATYNATEIVLLCARGGGGVSSLCPNLGAANTKVFTTNLTFQVPDANNLLVKDAEAAALFGVAGNRFLTMYGGTITSISAPTYSGDTDGNVSADIVVTFNATGSAVLFAWGGHLAQSNFWREGNNPDGAGEISGAPWHMRTQNLDDQSGNKNQDRSIQPSALDQVPGAKIALSPLTATNSIGDPHTVTVTVSERADVSEAYVPAAGETVTFTLTGSNGANPVLDAAASTCDDQLTNASGQCTIVFTSATAGTVTIHAQSSVSVGGQTILASSGTGGDNSGDALKDFVSGSLSWSKVDGDANNAFLGGAVFTVCGPTYPGCIDVTDNSAPDTDADAGQFTLVNLDVGTYTVTEKTPPPGYNAITGQQSATLTIQAPNATIANVFVNRAPNAFITIAPTSETNGLNEPHTFTAVLTAIPNGGSPVTIPDFTISVSPAPSTPGTTTCSAFDAATNSKTCTRTINSSSPGTFTANASGSVTVGVVTLSRDTDPATQTVSGPGGSGPATKIYIGGELTWTKVDGGNGNALLGGAVFTVCGPTYPSCIDVTDNAAPDTDADAGEFKLVGLALGTYTVEEKTPPPGYNKITGQQQATLTTEAPSASIPLPFVNRAPNAFITISPATATNSTTEAHTFTAVMTAVPNGGSPVSIPDFTISVSPAPSTPGTTTCSAFDAATNSKTCTRTINSTTAGTFTANATATATIGAVTLTRDTDPATTTIPAGPGGSGPAEKIYVAPNLVVTKEPDQGDAGSTLTPPGTASFTIVTTNTGQGKAFNVVLTDQLLADLTWSVGATSGWTSCSISAAQLLTCSVATLNAGASASVTVTAPVSSSFIFVPPVANGTQIEIDGNVAPNGGVDWETPGFISCVPVVLGCALDPSSSPTDNAMVEGAKEDDAVPSIEAGGIPPNKSDLHRFYIRNNRVTVGTAVHDFLYLAWERVNSPQGTTNMDFEFNQSTQLSANGITPVRTAGDVLIQYNLSNGGGNLTMVYHRWVTSGACEANGANAPCWGPAQSLAGAFQGQANSVEITDHIDPGDRTLTPLTFGEASIDLQAAGIFTGQSCLSFGRAYLKSRSSDSFTSTIKDFVAPIPISITNCQPRIIPNTATATADNASAASDNGQITVTAP